MKPVISTIATVLALALPAAAAQAETVCMPASEMQASLIDWYGEQPVTAPSENREQMWASKDSGTWTLVKTLADGNACVLAQGDDWMGGAEGQDLVAALIAE